MTLQCCFICDIDESVSDQELSPGDTKSQKREKIIVLQTLLRRHEIFNYSVPGGEGERVAE